MRSKFLATTFVAGSLCVGVSSLMAAPAAPANGQVPPKVEKMLQTAMAGSKWNVAGTRQINGVTVYDINVSNPAGESTAVMTEDGDFLVSGVPTAGDRIAGPVKNVIDHLFKTPPLSVSRVHVTTYPVDLMVNGQPTRVIFDAVGRVREVRSSGQMKAQEAEFAKDKEDDSPERRKRAAEAIKRIENESPTIDHMYAMPEVPNFDMVEFKNAKGRYVTVLTNGNDIFSHKVQVPEAELPAPIRNTINTMFKSDKVVEAAKRRYEYYNIEERDQNGDTVDIRVASDGVVMSAISSSAQKEEAAATHRAQNQLQVGHQAGGM